MKILVSSGATREPIDDVRFISNFSSGETGSLIADKFAEEGFDVTAAVGQGAVLPKKAASILRFGSFDDLDDLMKDELSSGLYVAVIHLAAVSDYSVEFIQFGDHKWKAPIKQKLDSKMEITLKLKKNFKIVEKIKSYSDHSLKLLFAFKLTSTADDETRKAAIDRLFQEGDIDYVVHNDLESIQGTSSHLFEIFDRSQRVQSGSTKAELAASLVNLVRSHL